MPLLRRVSTSTRWQRFWLPQSCKCLAEGAAAAVSADVAVPVRVAPLHAVEVLVAAAVGAAAGVAGAAAGAAVAPGPASVCCFLASPPSAGVFACRLPPTCAI